MANNKHRSTWMIAGAVGAGLAVVGVGLCFFFLANGELADRNDGNVNVDPVEGPYGTLTATMADSSIALLGTGDNSGYVDIDGVEDLRTSMVFNLSVAPAFIDENLNSTIRFDITLKSALPTVEAAGDLIGQREGENWTYIEFEPVSLTIATDDFVYSSETGRFLYGSPEVGCSFVWGSFFNGMNPQLYYNGLFAGESPALVPNPDNFRLVTDELNAMERAFAGSQIDLQLALSTF